MIVEYFLSIRNYRDEIKSLYCDLIRTGCAVVRKRYYENYDEIKNHFINQGFHIQENKAKGFEKFYIYLKRE